MTEPLKPVSSGMRAALALLGETPQEHQAERQAKSQPKARAHKLPPDAPLTPLNVIAKRWESESWRPDARVLFLRENTCKHCGQQYQAPHWPETFIRERLIGDSKSFRYTPSKNRISASLKLPHQIELLKTVSYTCHLCPEWAQVEQPQEQPICLQDLLLSHAAGIVSSQSQEEMNSTILQESESFSRKNSTLQPSTEPDSQGSLRDSSGSSNSPTDSLMWISQEPGLYSASSDSAQSAEDGQTAVKPMNSPITSERGNANEKQEEKNQFMTEEETNGNL